MKNKARKKQDSNDYYLNPYENLANAIVLQAVEDFRELKKSRNRKKLPNTVNIKEVVAFFVSDYFCAITNLNGEDVLR